MKKLIITSTNGEKHIFERINKFFIDGDTIHFYQRIPQFGMPRIERVRDCARVDSTVELNWLQSAINGIWGVNAKQKTRYIEFEFRGRLITLAGRNTGRQISVGHSVYCDNVLSKKAPKEPKDKDLSRKIAVGRMKKSPIYAVNVSDNPHRFIDVALDVARTKILKGEIIIKGIR